MTIMMSSGFGEGSVSINMSCDKNVGWEVVGLRDGWLIGSWLRDGWLRDGSFIVAFLKGQLGGMVLECCF